jgi:hypothetical protein
MAAARPPIVIGIDLEPDARLVTSAADPVGVARVLDEMRGVRSTLAELLDDAPRFTWFLRMDPQIERAYGSADALARQFDDELAAHEGAGDELGVHPHSWRWRDGGWVSDQADPTWVQHCADVGLETYEARFGRPCRAYRHGDRFMSTSLAQHLDRTGVRVDLSIEPGLAVQARLGDEPATGALPDTSDVPFHAYRPDDTDFRMPDRAKRDGLALVPLTPGVDVVLGPTDDALPSGAATTLVLWLRPDRFRDRLDRRLRSPSCSHLAFMVRSDVVRLPEHWAAVQLNLHEVARRLGPDHAWCTASEAADTALEIADAPGAELDTATAARWLHGTDDVGWREQIAVGAAPAPSVPATTARTSPRGPWISAVLSLRHRGEDARAAASVAHQTEPPAELIVVDAGERDGTVDTIAGLAAPFPIRVAARAASDVPRGELAAFIDADDVWHPRHLEILGPPFVLDLDLDLSCPFPDVEHLDRDGHLVARGVLDVGAEPSAVPALPSASVVRRSALHGGRPLRFETRAVTARGTTVGAATHARAGAGRVRFAEQVGASADDDQRAAGAALAEWLFQTTLDDYVREVSTADWAAAERSLDALECLARLRGERGSLRWRMAVVRSPRRFRRLVAINASLPEVLRPTRNPVLRLR